MAIQVTSKHTSQNVYAQHKMFLSCDYFLQNMNDNNNKENIVRSLLDVLSDENPDNISR